MNTKTIEGLVGARTSANLMSTPMQVYEEANRRGDTAAMKRAMGYASELAGKAEEYTIKADKGMEEDAKETREKTKLEREKAIQNRKEEREKLEKRIDENRNKDADTDTVEISEEGKAVLKDNIGLDNISLDETKTDMGNEPVTYTKTGEISYSEQGADLCVCV